MVGDGGAAAPLLFRPSDTWARSRNTWPDLARSRQIRPDLAPSGPRHDGWIPCGRRRKSPLYSPPPPPPPCTVAGASPLLGPTSRSSRRRRGRHAQAHNCNAPHHPAAAGRAAGLLRDAETEAPCPAASATSPRPLGRLRRRRLSLLRADSQSAAARSRQGARRRHPDDRRRDVRVAISAGESNLRARRPPPAGAPHMMVTVGEGNVGARERQPLLRHNFESLVRDSESLVQSFVRVSSQLTRRAIPSPLLYGPPYSNFAPFSHAQKGPIIPHHGPHVAILGIPTLDPHR